MPLWIEAPKNNNLKLGQKYIHQGYTYKIEEFKQQVSRFTIMNNENVKLWNKHLKQANKNGLRLDLNWSWKYLKHI
jgi:hypothetical protein